MSESLPGGSRRLTHAELDRKVASLRGVGGLYELIADQVERRNRPHCIEEGEAL